MSDPVIVLCPSCKHEHEDHDGFGVLYCERCGYCAHASISNEQCDFCRSSIGPLPDLPPVQKEGG